MRLPFEGVLLGASIRDEKSPAIKLSIEYFFRLLKGICMYVVQFFRYAFSLLASCPEGGSCGVGWFDGYLHRILGKNYTGRICPW